MNPQQAVEEIQRISGDTQRIHCGRKLRNVPGFLEHDQRVCEHVNSHAISREESRLYGQNFGVDHAHVEAQGLSDAHFDSFLKHFHERIVRANRPVSSRRST
jgi:hypothetical protein